MNIPNTADRLPLDMVAPDMRALVAAFRDGGEIAFQDVALDVARANYLRSCSLNGLPPAPMSGVEDIGIAVDGGAITLRHYIPEGGAGASAILFMHGGGWVVGDLDSHDGLCRAIAAQSGVQLFAIGYRLAPECRFPVPLQDCAAALAWLIDNAARLGIDPHRVAVCGDSAGGNLAAVLANEARLRPRGFDFAAQALLYPVTDLRAHTPSYARIARGFALSAPTMHWFRDHYVPAGHDLDDPWLSPLLADAQAALPTFMVTCGLDPLCDEGLAHAAALVAAGARLEHHHLPAHAHGLFTLAGQVRTGAVLVSHMARFLRDELEGAA